MKRYCGTLVIELVHYGFFFNVEVKEIVNGTVIADLKGVVAHGLTRESFEKDPDAGWDKMACLAVFAASLQCPTDQYTEVQDHKLVIKREPDGPGKPKVDDWGEK